jgi:hypothetical protein
MPDNESIDNLVDKAINEALEKNDEDIKKRKPKPFRFLTEDEVRDELKQDNQTSISIMKEDISPKIVDDPFCLVGLGNIEAIENVIKKHQVSRKFKGK